jgi:hypothetical protein
MIGEQVAKFPILIKRSPMLPARFGSCITFKGKMSMENLSRVAWPKSY